MAEEKIKALGIAPYEGMKSLMMQLASKRTDIDLTVYVGDLNKGVEIAQKNFHSNYDVIISRGGTAEMIEKISDIPLIEISLSVYDILRAMKLAENYADRYAVVGFSSITNCAHLLCDLFQYKVDIFTIHEESEVTSTLKDLKKRGYRMVLCDMIANTTAKKLGLNAILITSGNESINTAFDQAVKLCSSYANIRNENRFLGEVLRGQSNSTVVFRSDGSIYFSTLEQDNTDSILHALSKDISDVLESGSHKCFKNIGGTLYSITGKRIESDRQVYAAFYFSSDLVPMATSKYGIKYSNKQEAEDLFFNSFYSVTSSSGTIQGTLEQLNQNQYPLMITGEPGSGKEQVVGVLYSRSQLCNNPLITINCPLLGDKGWNFLTNHYNSPLGDNNNTIYFKELNALSELQRKQLLSIIVDMNLCKRNRMIFSCITKPGETMSAAAQEYVNSLGCLTLYMPPLREMTQEIPTLSSLYLSTLNVNLATQIIGFEPDALPPMLDYDWPYNYTQFKRVLSELAIMTKTPYISLATVNGLLDKERTALLHDDFTAGTSSEIPGFDTNRTLEEMNHDIINRVLKEVGGNQSAAAKRLGIGRTTLWRYLK